MKLKPTITKMRLVLSVLATLAVYLSAQLLSRTEGRITLALAVVGLALAAIYVYFAAALPKLLGQNVRRITSVMLFSMAWLIFMFLANPLAGPRSFMGYIALLMAVMTWYLLRSVKHPVT